MIAWMICHQTPCQAFPQTDGFRGAGCFIKDDYYTECMIVLETCNHIQYQVFPQTDRQIGLELSAVLYNDKMDKMG